MTKQDQGTPGSSSSWREDWKGDDYNRPIEMRMAEERLGHLEARCRRQEFGLIALTTILLAMAAIWLFPKEAPVHNMVRTERIEVLTPEGRPVVILDSDRIGGRLAIRFNRSGDPPPQAAFLYAAVEGGAFQLYEPGENFFAVSAKVEQDGNGRLDLRGRGRRSGLELRGPAQPDQGGILRIFDQQGQVKTEIPGKP